MSNSSTSGRASANAWVLAVSAAVVAALIVLPFQLLAQNSPNNSSADSEETQEPLILESGDPDSSESDSATSGGAEPVETPNPPAGFRPVELARSDAVDSGRCEIYGWSGYGWEEGAPSIGGVPHPRGFTCRVAYAATSGFVDYLVPAGASTFAVVAGQADDSANTTLVMRFEVINTVTGAVMATHDLAYSQAGVIEVQVSGVTRTTLRVSMLSYGISPKEEHGTAAWAEPVFR